MKVIVTGSGGMLGTDLVQILQQHHDVLGCDVHNCDILKYDQLENMVSSYQPDIIIHTAAYTNVDQAESDPDAAMRLNETGTEYVAAVAKQYRAKLVYISTDYVFDGTHTRPYTEQDMPHPLGVYGNTKLQGERQIQRIFNDQIPEAHTYLIVRTAWLYGQHGRNFVSAILERAQQQKSLDVVNDQTGSPTYTKDLARAILALIDRHASGIVHVTNDGYCTWYEFAKTILEYAQMFEISVQPITTAELHRPAPRPAFSVLDTSKFRALTGQKLRHWKQGLQAYFEEGIRN